MYTKDVLQAAIAKAAKILASLDPSQFMDLPPGMDKRKFAEAWTELATHLSREAEFEPFRDPFGPLTPAPADKTVHEILAEVETMLSDRENNYDHPDPNFERIRDLWRVVIESIPPDERLSKRHVAIMMDLLKMAREIHKHKPDNWLDTIGYGCVALRLTLDDEREKRE